MTPSPSGGDWSPRRQGPVWVIIALAVAWAGLIILRAAPNFSFAANTADTATALLPPVIIIVFAASVLRSWRTDPAIADMEARLATALEDANHLDRLVQSVERSLLACAEQTGQLKDAAAAAGDGLLASAGRLSAGAGDVVRSAAEANGVTDRLAGTLPALVRVSETIDAMGGRLGSEIVRQVEVVDALLASVRVRGDEVSLQADAAIASMNTQLAEIDEESRQMTTRIAKRAYALDSAVDGAAARATTLLDTVAATIAERMAAMDEHLAGARGALEAITDTGMTSVAERLKQLERSGAAIVGLLQDGDGQATRLRDGLDAHLAALPSRLAEATAGSTAAVDHLLARVDRVHDGLAGLDAPLAASDAAIAALGAALSGVEHDVDGFVATLTTALPDAVRQIGQLDVSAVALDRRIAAVGAALDASDAVAKTITAQVEVTRREAAALGEADLRLVDDRMNATATVLADVGRQIAAYGHQSAETRAHIEADLAALDRLWRATHDGGGERLVALSDRVAAMEGTLTLLAVPLGAAERQLGGLEAQVGAIGIEAAALGSRLDRQLAATADAFATLHDGAGDLVAKAAALQETADAGSVSVSGLAEQFAGERATVTAAIVSLADDFGGLHAKLDGLDAATRRVTAGAATDLGATFARAETLAAAAADSLRTLLAGIVDDTGAALGERGAAVATVAFAEPIRRELAAIHASADEAVTAADTAAHHVAGRAVSLTTTINGLAAQVAELETILDVRSRDTLTARAARLVEMLGTASVDVTALLSIDAGDQAWVDYLKGDRGVFARRVVRQLDRATNDKIARHFAYDDAFKAEASHYLDLFDRLNRRLISDPDGEALRATVLSSDLGKLYVAIARATGQAAAA